MADDCVTKVAETFWREFEDYHTEPCERYVGLDGRQKVDYRDYGSISSQAKFAEIIERAIHMTIAATVKYWAEDNGFIVNYKIAPHAEAEICARILQALEAEKKA